MWLLGRTLTPNCMTEVLVLQCCDSHSAFSAWRDPRTNSPERSSQHNTLSLTSAPRGQQDTPETPGKLVGLPQPGGPSPPESGHLCLLRSGAGRSSSLLGTRWQERNVGSEDRGGISITPLEEDISSSLLSCFSPSNQPQIS